MATKHQKIFLCIFSMVLKKKLLCPSSLSLAEICPKKETTVFKPHHKRKPHKTKQTKNRA